MATPTTDINLGPLTTTFSPPAACTSLTVSYGGGSSYAPYVYPRLFSSIVASCFPPSYPVGASAVAATYGPYNNFDQHVYYSPGLCPSGWNSNAAGTSGSETTAFCCGPGFAAVTSPGVIGGFQTESTLSPSAVGSTVITTIAYTGDGAKEGSTQVFTFSNVQIPAPAVWIRYKEADFAGAARTTGGAAQTSTTTAPSPSATGTGGTGTQNTTPTSKTGSGTQVFITVIGTVTSTITSLPSTSSSPPSSSSLPTGAKIGLGVGIPVGVIAIALLVFFLLRRRRKGNSAVGGGVSDQPVEKLEDGMRGGIMTSELAAKSGPVSRVELGAGAEETRHELPANQPESWGGRMRW